MAKWPRAVIFDFDGVIVHSEPLHCRAFQEVLAAEGIDLSEREYYLQLIGFDDVGCIRHLFEHRRLPLEPQRLRRLVDAKQRRMVQLMESGAFHALPGVQQFVRQLAENKVAMAICSGAIGTEIRTMLQGVGLAEHFPIIVAAEDVTVGKPDPRGYLLALQRLAQRMDTTLRPEQCLIVEDAPTVIRTARGVGFKVLGVATSYPLEELGQANWAAASLEREQLLPIAPELGWLYDHSGRQ